jgi:hypothetical protein
MSFMSFCPLIVLSQIPAVMMPDRQKDLKAPPQETLRGRRNFRSYSIYTIMYFVAGTSR